MVCSLLTFSEMSYDCYASFSAIDMLWYYVCNGTECVINQVIISFHLFPIDAFAAEWAAAMREGACVCV